MAQFSNRCTRLQASPIREILAVIEQPGMISFAGGLPAAETFPEFDINAVPAKYLQYGASEGEPELRAELQRHLSKLGFSCSQQQILVLSGSQQGIDLVAKLFIDPGTAIAVESPTYLAALQVFNFFGAQFVEFNAAKPEAMLNSKATPNLAYVIPTFQNPTGYCYTAKERQALADTCDNKGITLFEDDPYRDLVYTDCDRTPICSLLKQSSWIYQGSFSKSLAPGLRLGFLLCSPDLIQPLTRLKQAADLHSNRLSQYLVLKQIQQTDYQQKLTQLANIYRDKKDHFAALLQQYLSAFASWQEPQGGLFFWLKLDENIETDLLLKEGIKNNIAFMPGTYFFADANSDESFIRLNFSHANKVDAEQGLQTLAQLLGHVIHS